MIMDEDTDVFHGLPILPSLERHSPTANDYPKHPQQHRSPCTTQAPSQTMANDKAVALSDYCTSPEAPFSPKLETFVPAHVPDSSQNPDQEPSGTQNGEAEPSQHGFVFGEQRPSPQYNPEELQQRMKVMWPSEPLESEGYDRYGVGQGSSSDAGTRGYPLLSVNPLQDGDDYGTRGSPQEAWVTAPQNLLHQQYAWRPSQTSNQALDHQALYYTGRIGLATSTGEVLPSPRSASFHGVEESLKCESAETDYLNPNSAATTSSSQGYLTTADSFPTTLSPCSSSLAQLGQAFTYDPPQSLPQDREATQPLSEHWGMDEYGDDLYCPPDDVLDGSPSSIELPGSKVDEPYARLIYRAFMSRSNRSMTLQEIYQWFRENTDKTNSEGKGWQNSIRHNLSMNGAFTKRNSKAAIRDPSDGSLSFDPAAVDGRKSTEWYLEPKFYGGVESTTRYRRGNSGSRSRAAASGHSSSKGGGRAHDGRGSYSDARVSAGRKGGNVAAQNRRRQAEKQQQQQQQARAHMARYAMRAGPVPDMPPPQYPSGYPMEAGRGFHNELAGAAAHLSTSSPFAPGIAQNGRHVEMNYFGTRDLGNNLDIKRSATLGTDRSPPNEPVTPPGSGADPPSRSAERPGGQGHGKHGEYLPDSDVLGLYGNGYAGEQQLLHGSGLRQQLSGYGLGSVTGVYVAPAGGEQPPVFYDDAAALFGMLEHAQH